MSIKETEIETKKETNGFIKHDEGKTPFSYLPLEALEMPAYVMQYGAKKYKKDNWRKGLETEEGITRYKDATLRHVFSAMEDVHSKDPSSDLPHLAHAICNLLILSCLKKPKP